MVSDGKQAVNLTEHPLYLISHFLAVFKILSLPFSFRQFDNNVSCCGALSLSFLEFVEHLICVNSCLLIWGSFWPLFLPSIFFCFIFYAPFGTLMYVGMLAGPTGISGSVFLHCFFCLFSRLETLS